VDGNIRVSDTAFFNSLHLKSGDPYDERAIQDEFRRLWDLDLFDDINVESRKREGNVYDLIFHVRDRPLVGNVAFVGMKAVTEANIQERLNQAKCEVKRGQPVDFSVLSRAEAAIEQLLAEKGYLQARAKARLTPVGQGQREVTFHIREGAKTKIRKIDFTGNTMFTDRRLRKMLKLTKQAFWLTSWASSKTLYHPAKFDQDAENIRTSYKSVGYLDIAIQPEIVELVGGKPKKPQGAPKSLTLVAPGTTPGAQGLEGEDEEDFEEPPPAPAPPGETEKQRTRRVKAELKAKNLCSACYQRQRPKTARVRRVGTFAGVKGGFKSIQKAVDKSEPGDWVLVAPGDYKEKGTRAPAGAAEAAGGKGAIRLRRPDPFHQAAKGSRQSLAGGGRRDVRVRCRAGENLRADGADSRSEWAGRSGSRPRFAGIPPHGARS